MLPLGQFAHMRQFPDASAKGVVKPNVDTLYSFAWLTSIKNHIS